MTTGSPIHDEVSQHFRDCATCRDVNPEAIRLAGRAVPSNVIAKLCPEGCSIYTSYLRWLRGG